MLFPAWETFYVIVGSSAGALTGLMFVVVALVADLRGGSSERQLDAFGTPTVVHFGAALLLSIILAAPWPTILALQVALAMFGAAGAAYMVIVTRRARRQTEYTPVFEDWIFHTALPFAGYAATGAAGAWLPRQVTASLFAIGTAATLLVFVGLHNAWDTVTFVVATRWHERRDGDSGRSS